MHTPWLSNHTFTDTDMCTQRPRLPYSKYLSYSASTQIVPFSPSTPSTARRMPTSIHMQHLSFFDMIWGVFPTSRAPFYDDEAGMAVMTTLLELAPAPASDAM